MSWISFSHDVLFNIKTIFLCLEPAFLIGFFPVTFSSLLLEFCCNPAVEQLVAAKHSRSTHSLLTFVLSPVAWHQIIPASSCWGPLNQCFDKNHKFSTFSDFFLVCVTTHPLQHSPRQTGLASVF